MLHLRIYFIDKSGLQALCSVTQDVLASTRYANQRSALHAGHLCPESGDFPLSKGGETSLPVRSLGYKFSGMRTNKDSTQEIYRAECSGLFARR